MNVLARTLATATILSATLAAGLAGELLQPELSRLRIKPEALVRGDVVRLADVLDFSQADPTLARALGDKPALVESAGAAVIGYQQINEQLARLGVNMARVLVCGASQCRILRPTAPPPATGATAPEAAPLLRPQPHDGRQTLADVLRQRLQRELARLGGTVEVEFERAGAEFLALTTPPFEFSVRGGRGATLGLREYRVTIRRDGRTQRTVRIGARVRLTKRVLVAARPLNMGTYITSDSLEYAPRAFTSADDLGIDHVEQVVGQQVRHFVPAGAMVRKSDLKDVDLVRRSQPVTVIGGGPVSVRITGDALDSGGFGDTIRVRLGENRRSRRVVRGVVTGVGTVRLENGSL